jgi:tRNA A37 N6-isopentenylltransferase MiaA
MSRIGNKQIVLPEGVTVTVNENVATVTGPKGTLEVAINTGIVLHQEGNVITLTRENERKQTKQNHGTTRANLYNAVVGVHEGYKKSLEMKGIGYKEIIGYFEGKYSEEEAIDLIKKNTRHLAKRQITWFKRYEDIHWIDISQFENDEKAIEGMLEWLKSVY